MPLFASLEGIYGFGCTPDPLTFVRMTYTGVGTTSWVAPVQTTSVNCLVVGGGGGSGNGGSGIVIFTYYE
jgi:hypothetical protein